MDQHTPPADWQLDQIAATAAHLYEYGQPGDAAWEILAETDVPRLVAEVRRQRAELAAARDRIAELEDKKPRLCGRTRDISGTEHGPCSRKAGHQEAYCRSERGASYFLAVAADQPRADAACDRLHNLTLTAQIGYPVRCPHCPPGTTVPPTHWTKHVQRHHPHVSSGPAVARL